MSKMEETVALVIRESHWRSMLEHVQSCLPEEACGLLGGHASEVEVVIPVENTEHSPVRYRMDPQEQVRSLLSLEGRGMELVGIYHSHPLGPAGFSATDFKDAAYPEAAYLVWSRSRGTWVCRAFRIGEGLGVVEITLTVIDDERA